VNSTPSDNLSFLVAETKPEKKQASAPTRARAGDRKTNRSWGVAAVLLAAGPGLIAATAMIAQHPSLYFDGDPAKDELALINAGHFAQLVGNNGRFGWSHPGPAWYYSLEVFYGPLGGHSWAFVAANLLINAIAMALIVAVAWRARGPLLALVACGALLAYVGLIGEQLFRDVWPPYAVILPMLLFFFLSATGAAGSTPAIVGALVVGSYAVQLHLGTAPTVAAVMAGALALRLGADHFPRWAASIQATRVPRPRLDRPLVLGGLFLFVLMWIPPAIDELTGHPGNLTLLWTFFTRDYPKHQYVQALSILGRLITPLEWHRIGSLQPPDISRVSPAFIAIAVAFEGVSLCLVVAATVVRDRFARSVGAIVTIAALAVTVSIQDVDGPVYAYLLLWVTCLPVVLAVGWIALTPHLQLRLRRKMPRLLREKGVVVFATAIAVLSVAGALAFLTLPPHPIAAPDTRNAWALTSAALDREPKGPVLVDMYTPDTWVIAAGVALQLVKDGRPIRVRDNWVFLFGHQARMTGTENIVLAFVDLPDSATYAAQHPGANLIGQTDAHAIFMTRAS
jgi:hypothetical protein